MFEGTVLLDQFENVPAACRFPGSEGELKHLQYVQIDVTEPRLALSVR